MLPCFVDTRLIFPVSLPGQSSYKGNKTYFFSDDDQAWDPIVSFGEPHTMIEQIQNDWKMTIGKQGHTI